MIEIRDALIQHGYVSVDARMERFSSCSFEDIYFHISGPPEFVFVNCYFKGGNADKIGKEYLSGCIIEAPVVTEPR